jgi:hypothetical protein
MNDKRAPVKHLARWPGYRCWTRAGRSGGASIHTVSIGARSRPSLTGSRKCRGFRNRRNRSARDRKHGMQVKSDVAVESIHPRCAP